MSRKDAAFVADGFHDDRRPARHRRPAARIGSLSLLAAALSAGLLSAGAGRAQTVNDAVDDAFWDSVKTCTAPAEVQAYIDEFEKGRHVRKARECLAWLDLGLCNDIGQVRDFLAKYPTGKHAPDARKCLARLEIEQRVADLLKECRAHRSGGRLTSGIAGNALECYRKVLDIKPGNRQALAGIADLAKHYVQKAASELQGERPAAAERAIGQLAKIAPEHAQIEPLKAQLQALKARIAERKRLKAARDALRRKVEALLAQGKPEQARAALEAGAAQGLSGKTMEGLAEKVRVALKKAAEKRALAAKVGEVRSLLDRGNVAGARRALTEARSKGLEAAAARDLEAAIAAADRAARRKAALAEFDDLVGRNNLAGARAALERARRLGLPEAGYRERLERLKARDVGHRIATCKGHLKAHRTAAALECYRKILKTVPDHAAAQAAVRRLATLEAWNDTKRRNTVDGYWEFERANSGSSFAKLARQRLKQLEVTYWKSVVASGTRAAYARYLEIFPKGRFAALAKLRLTRSD